MWVLEEHGFESRVFRRRLPSGRLQMHAQALLEAEPNRMLVRHTQLPDRRASFASAGDLEVKIRAFVNFYNSNMKKLIS
jgi:hypothetical protein